jgi:ABC-type transporter Mla maintaining outer membrane lipid asymmetry ATPase subunit MlaF
MNASIRENASTAGGAAVTATGLRKAYGSTVVLDGIDLSILRVETKIILLQAGRS